MKILGMTGYINEKLIQSIVVSIFVVINLSFNLPHISM